MHIRAAVLSETGDFRENNEDNFYFDGIIRENIHENRTEYKLDKEGKKFLFAVCDGMGGQESGEVASLCAVKNLEIINEKGWNSNGWKKYKNEVTSFLSGEYENAGSTFAAIMLDGKRLYFSNIGDSRIYLFRGGKLQRLSKDHTQAQLLVDNGLLSEEQAREHISAHILTAYIGAGDSFDNNDFLENTDLDLKNNDIYFLCSDGMTDNLLDTDIEQEIKKEKDVGILINNLCSKARKNGSHDNITCMAIYIEEVKRYKFLF